MKRILQILSLIIFISFSDSLIAQCTGINAGTPNSTSSCTDFDAVTPISGSSPCAGPGHGGSGSVRIIRFCTNSTAECLVFSTSGLNASDGIVYSIYSTCTGSGSLSGYVSGSASCDGNTSTSTYTTSGVTLAANTCYYLRVWTKNAPSSSASTCIYTQTPPQDACSGAVPIDATPSPSDNYCTTPGPTANTPTITPGNLCAGSLENTAWYSFTLQNTGDVVLTIANIICSGGGAGFQIGYFTGSCGSLSNFGCTSGSGGTVTVTITGGTAGQTIYVAIDGNAGANCTFDISATNTVPLPIELLDFNAFYSEETKNVLLDWTTISEINNDYFTIEKSIDGENFEVVSIIDGAGNSSELKSYNALDKNPISGTSYYRLKQTDFDGKYEYSDLIPVRIEEVISNPTIYPNPITNNGVLEFSTNSTEVTVVTVYDVSGRAVLSNQHFTNKGINKIQLETSELTNGMYFIGLKNGNSKTNLKFIKE
ncbi:MAG: T9SS type A sorting domain-containing protein [Flavobacteriales bacterium]|nr:T9SS type A sorting domain-containing protein [Flavobacteriales bacterium]MCW8912800.1 T9SS type A sorting domain-containing protein [Flavobacteriales bacterium]MCW8938804.1 T9SS type A sorting domain-containing protein [Flavobacteriales bacterium]MCW8940971.1 T9SS type A sorting domain-containing protein [Flavobacteriales bacterium]MCW8968514.1 T9SS type A sorting domain-containing protein [Flavobacteriales bacterium]